MNVRMMPPQGPMGQPMPMGGAPAPMPPQGGPMMPPAPTTPQSQQGKGLGSAFGGSVQGRQGFKQFMAAKKQTSAMVPQVAQAQMPRPSPVQAPQPMLPAPSPQMMGAMRPMGGGQASMPVQAGRPMRGTQGGLGSAPVQLNRGGVVDMAPTDGQLGLFVGGQRQDSVPGVYQKMLRSGLPRDEAFGEIESLRDSAMHVAEDLGKFLETPHAGFEHSHGDFRAAGFAEGGEVEIPRETEIMGVPHYLAYIQPEEGDILEDLGGLGEPIGPGGIPTYIIHKPGSFFRGGGGSTKSDSGSGGGGRDRDADAFAGSNYAPTSNAGTSDATQTFRNVHTGETFATAGDLHASYGFDDDDNNNSSAVTVSTPTTNYVDTSSISGIIDASGIDVGVPGIDTSYASGKMDADLGVGATNTGLTYSGDDDAVSGGFDFDFDDDDNDNVTSAPTGVVDFTTIDPDTGTQTPVVSIDYGDDDDGYVAPVIVDTTPAPAPVYYDMFGGQHSSQAAADAADAKYTAEAVAAEAVETVTSTPSDTTYSYTGADTDAGSDTDPASVYESSIFREASVPLPGGAGPTSEDIMPGITGTEAGVGAGERTEAEENALRALYNMDPIGVDADEDDDLKTAVEDIYNIGLEGEFGGLDLDVPEAEADVGLQKASAEFPTGPFREPEETGLESMEQELASDYTEGMTPFEKSEIESLAEDYYITGAGQDGYNYEDDIADDLDIPDYMNALVDQESDLNALDLIAQELDSGDDDDTPTIFPEEEEEDDIVVGGEDDQQTQLPEGSTSASQLYLNAAGRQYKDLTEAEQRALYGARGQTPNAAEAAYLQSLLRSVKHAEDGPIDTREKIPASGITTYGSYIDEDGNFVGSDEITGGTGFDAQGNPIMIDNPNYGKPMYEEGDSVAEQTLGETFEDLLIKALDLFVNPVSILGDKFTLEGQNAAYIQEQLDAYREGGTFVYAEDGKTVVGVAKPNYDADGDGVNDTVVLNNENGDFITDGDDIIVTSDGISVDDVKINDDVDGENEDDDIEIVYSDTTFENTEDGVVETNVGGTDTTTTGGDDPCNDGYYLDPTTNACTPLDGVGTEEGDAEAARITLSLRKIDRGGGDVTLPTPTPVEGEALTIRKPAQFFEGGGVYGPDSDYNDVDRYYRSSGNQGYIVSDYGPGYSTYQLGEGEDPAGLMNYLDNQDDYQVYKDTAPADSMDDGSAFLGLSSRSSPATQGQEGQVSYMDDLIDSQKPEPVIEPDPIEPMIIRAPKQFAQGGMVTPNIDRFLQSLGA